MSLHAVFEVQGRFTTFRSQVERYLAEGVSSYVLLEDKNDPDSFLLKIPLRVFRFTIDAAQRERFQPILGVWYRARGEEVEKCLVELEFDYVGNQVQPMTDGIKLHLQHDAIEVFKYLLDAAATKSFTR